MFWRFLYNGIPSELYRFAQISKPKNAEKLYFPSIPSIPSFGSISQDSNYRYLPVGILTTGISRPTLWKNKVTIPVSLKMVNIMNEESFAGMISAPKLL